jgi:cobalt-zinc-cadmium efflux system outer membrane protein
MHIRIRRGAIRLAVCWTAVWALSLPAAHAQERPRDALSLVDAIELALDRHPEIAASAEAQAAVDARKIQAGLRPNPELSVELEDFRLGGGAESSTATRDPGGTLLDRSRTSGANSGFGESQFTLSVAQRIELGGKRAKRIGLANESQQLALWESEIVRADIIAGVRRAFVDVLGAQERVRLRRQLLTLAEEAAAAVQARVDAGKVTPLQGNRASVAVAQARIELTAAEHALNSARHTLAAQWDDFEPRFASVRGDLYAVQALPSVAALEQRIARSPDLRRWAAEIARAEAAVDLERAQATPDMTVSLGWRAAGLGDSTTSTYDPSGVLQSTARSSHENDWNNSFVLGFSVPLPFFNRNQGSIREARHLVSRASHERRAEALAIRTRLVRLHYRLNALSDEIRELEDTVIPAATTTFDSTRVGFEGGKFSYLDVLDTQRTLFGVRNQHIEALAAYHQGVAEMERFIGQSLSASEPADQPLR